jgi:hypothetical protein
MVNFKARPEVNKKGEIWVTRLAFYSHNQNQDYWNVGQEQQSVNRKVIVKATFSHKVKEGEQRCGSIYNEHRRKMGVGKL